MYPDPKFISAIGNGKLFIMGKPSGGENLPDDIAHLKRLGITGIVSLLEREEAADLELTNQGAVCSEQGISFEQLPIPDRSEPRDNRSFLASVHTCHKKILEGNHFVAHCRAGIGRSGVYTSAILIVNGLSATAAIEEVSLARGFSIPDTQVQIDWLQDHEEQLQELSQA